MSQPTIVVGLDHTPAGRGALRYALERATTENGRLRVVRAVPSLEHGTPQLEYPAREERGAGHGAFDWVFDIVATSDTPVPITVETIEGSPADVLTQLSSEAAALVVGTPDSPDAVLTDAILISLRRNSQCLLIEVTASGGVARASGPVISSTSRALTPHRNVPASPPAVGAILVVGFDGSVGGADALEWALGHARMYGAGVEVVAAYRLGADESATDARAGAERMLSQGLLRIDQYPEVTVSSQAVLGEPVDVLTRVSGRAEMLVLGRHGTTGMLHSAMGSVGDACSRLADCAVTIVPAPQSAIHNEAELESVSS